MQAEPDTLSGIGAGIDPLRTAAPCACASPGDEKFHLPLRLGRPVVVMHVSFQSEQCACRVQRLFQKLIGPKRQKLFATNSVFSNPLATTLLCIRSDFCKQPRFNPFSFSR